MTTTRQMPEPEDRAPEHLQQLQQDLQDARHPAASAADLDEVRARWGASPEVQSARAKFGGRRVNDPAAGRW